MVLAWVTLVARLLPDWALKSLEKILTDPDFTMETSNNLSSPSEISRKDLSRLFPKLP
jgi:hypothetical protein